MNDDSVPIKERRVIAQDLLDRAGLGERKIHEHTILTPWEESIADGSVIQVVTNLELTESEPGVVDAEVVEDADVDDESRDHLREGGPRNVQL